MVQTDKTIEHCVKDRDKFDAILVPGGAGTAALSADAKLIELLRHQKAAGKLFGAIGTAPVDVLQRHQLLTGAATCTQGMEAQLGEHYVDKQVVVTGNCATKLQS